MRWSILVLLLLSLACSKKEAEAPGGAEQVAVTQSARAPEAAEPTPGIPEDPTAEVPWPKGAPKLPSELATPAPALSLPPVVQVLKQGQEPRQALLWSLKPGDEQKVSLDVAFSLDAVVVVLRVREAPYVVSYDLTLRTGALERDGSVRVAFAVDAADIDMKQVGDKRVSRLEEALTTTRKITGSYTLGPRGRMSDLEMKLPADATRTSHDMADNLGWALGAMTPAFPEEPLGRGAKWKVHEGVKQRGIHVNQLRTMEILNIDGNRVELAINVQQSAAKQSFQDPGLPITHELTLLSGTAEGTLGWQRTKLAPRTADVSANVLKAVAHGSNQADAESVEVIVQAKRALKIIER